MEELRGRKGGRGERYASKGIPMRKMRTHGLAHVLAHICRAASMLESEKRHRYDLWGAGDPSKRIIGQASLHRLHMRMKSQVESRLNARGSDHRTISQGGRRLFALC